MNQQGKAKSDEQSRELTRQVRVSYGSDGGGLQLAPAPMDSQSQQSDDSDDGGVDGLLRIGDGCVTLELPMVDGKISVLAWDPAEVGLDDVGLSDVRPDSGTDGTELAVAS